MNTTQTDRQSAVIPQCLPTLRVLYSSSAGVISQSARVLVDGVVPIGREPPAGGVALHQDGRASRVHASLHIAGAALGRGATLRLIDAGSKNGTFVNGERSAEALLRDGDLIRIGNSLLLLRMEDAQQADADIAEWLGCAPAARILRSHLRRAAAATGAVLLLGESGSGKEVASRAVHRLSSRAERPFIAVNCAAIPETLAESYFFGHKRGAFTNANSSPGFFRSASGGSLFLDEVGDLPLAIQPKLFRALEEGAILPVGASRPEPCDVRIIAATNLDLEEKMRSGAFRPELYARLAAITVRLPALRQRREDILNLFVQHFCTVAARTPNLTVHLAEKLVLHDWPFNVRELYSLVESLRDQPASAELDASVAAERLGLTGERGERATSAAASVPPEQALVAPGTPQLPPRPRGIPFSREALLELLARHNGLILRLAKAVGRSPRQVRRWFTKYEIHVDKPKPGEG